MFEMIDHRGAAVPGKRIRKIDCWRIQSAVFEDETVYFIVGRTTEEADGKPLDFFRATKTSPIAKCEKNIVTTESGSQYTLLEANKVWLKEANFTIDEKCYIPEDYWLKEH